MPLDPLPTDVPASSRPAQEAMRDRINVLSAQGGGGGGGYLPDYANAVVIANPSPAQLTATGNLFAQFTPQSAGWTLVIVRYALQVVGHAQVNLDIESVDTTVIYDAVTLQGVASGPDLRTGGDMHALVPGDGDYAISGSAFIFDSGMVGITSITEVPAL